MVAYLTTHNSFNSGNEGFLLPNQTYSISQQLNDGVRALMIDVYNYNNVPTVYHGYSYLGTAPLISNLNEIKEFLDENPNEVITIIFEAYTTATAIASVFEEAGLLPYVYTKPVYGAWPTLQQLIDSGKRLIVFSDENDAIPGLEWYHYVWHHSVETHYSVSNIDNFTCDYNRGNPNNDLFIFNHFVTGMLGNGSLATAEQVNANPFFINRAIGCWESNQKFPNFITVDFYEAGQCLEVVNTLNSLHTVNFTQQSSNSNISVFYCIDAKTIDILIPENIESPAKITVYSITGQLVYSKKLHVVGESLSLPIGSMNSGAYFISLTDNAGNERTARFMAY